MAGDGEKIGQLQVQALFRVFSFQLGLARQRYTGTLELQWKDGEVRFVRTESGRTPEELPGEDAELVVLLEHARAGT